MPKGSIYWLLERTMFHQMIDNRSHVKFLHDIESEIIIRMLQSSDRYSYFTGLNAVEFFSNLHMIGSYATIIFQDSKRI